MATHQSILQPSRSRYPHGCNTMPMADIRTYPKVITHLSRERGKVQQHWMVETTHLILKMVIPVMQRMAWLVVSRNRLWANFKNLRTRISLCPQLIMDAMMKGKKSLQEM